MAFTLPSQPSKVRWHLEGLNTAACGILPSLVRISWEVANLPLQICVLRVTIQNMSIVRDDDVLDGEPRIVGTRIGVRHVAARVVDNGQSPAYVADQLDLALADVYESLSYYYAHIDQMRAIEAENEAAFEHIRESSLKPKETAK